MSPSKKRRASESQDDVSNSSPRKKKTLKSDVKEMEYSECQNSQASSVLCELEVKDLNSTEHGNTNEIKVERNQHEESHISDNDAEANEIDNKASLRLSILSALNDTAINKDSPSKKKKKKKKSMELEDTVLEDVSEHITENALGENDEENPTDAKKKKKKKKKKHRAEEQSDDEHMNTEAEAEEIDTEMSFLDTKRMFEDIQKRLEDKTVNVKTFWDDYRLRPYSSKVCKMTFEKIMLKVQKKRTFLELVTAGGKMMMETPSAFFMKNIKELKPVTPLKLFSKSHYKKLSAKHPEYRGIDVLNKITRKWAKLSDQRKLKYLDLALAKKPEYLEDVKRYQAIDASFVAKPVLNKYEWQIKDRLAGLPDGPAWNAYNLFAQKSSELYPDMSPSERHKKLCSDFKLLPAEVKEKYSAQVREDKKKYDPLLKNYLDTLSPTELEDRNLARSSKKSKSKEEKPGSSFLSNKPPMSGYMLFSRELREELKGTPIIRRQLIVSDKWKALTEEQRMEYNKRRLVLHENWLKELKSKIEESSSNDV